MDTVGLRTVCLEGYEADDVMATLACDARDRGMKVYIVTRDKDMMQLVDGNVFLFDLGKAMADSQVVGAKEVKEKMGVDPAHIVDYLSLMGDASDNVPGVAKIGPKTAVELIDTYGSLDRIYQFVDNIPKKGTRENLKADRENAFLSGQLVTLSCKLELPLGLDDLRYAGRGRGGHLRLPHRMGIQVPAQAGTGFFHYRRGRGPRQGRFAGRFAAMPWTMAPPGTKLPHWPQPTDPPARPNWPRLSAKPPWNTVRPSLPLRPDRYPGASGGLGRTPAAIAASSPWTPRPRTWTTRWRSWWACAFRWSRAQVTTCRWAT